MKFTANLNRKIDAVTITARCPHCGVTSVLEPIQGDVVVSGETICGQRRCPIPECNGHIFVVIEKGKLLAAYPGVRIDFDSTGIPDSVLKSFEEALDCHTSGLFISAAIMIRRALEDICEDRGAKGGDLKARIKALSSKVIIPQELLDGMDELRILGNDAAHVNAKAYASISDAELRVAIEFAKEILKALYQYAGLLEKLRALKSPGGA
jgi:hypothetical protein